MHMCPPHPPIPHFITFDDLFPAEVMGICSFAEKYCSRVVKFICRELGFPSEPRHVMIYRGLANMRENDCVRHWQVFLCHQLIRQTSDIMEKAAKIAEIEGLLQASLVFQRSEIFLNFATQPSLLHITPPPPPRPPAQIQSPDHLSILSLSAVEREKQQEEGGLVDAAPGSSAGGVKMFEIWDQRCMISRLGMWPPRAQQFVLRQASGVWPPTTLFLSHIHALSGSVSALRPGSDVCPTLLFPTFPLGSVCKCEDEIERTNYETQRCIPYLV